MGVLQRLKHDVKAGMATLRLGTAQVANRALEETELLRIRLEIRKLDQQLGELYPGCALPEWISVPSPAACSLPICSLMRS
ncbi:MAG: hypothetical protein NTX84_00270 [Nitrospirae bacterium]|nr:hypothetical protein [Nitrospirota bacterium]